jgi:hypothetical protein
MITFVNTTGKDLRFKIDKQFITILRSPFWIRVKNFISLFGLYTDIDELKSRTVIKRVISNNLNSPNDPEKPIINIPIFEKQPHYFEVYDENIKRWVVLWYIQNGTWGSNNYMSNLQNPYFLAYQEFEKNDNVIIVNPDVYEIMKNIEELICGNVVSLPTNSENIHKDQDGIYYDSFSISNA